MFEIFIRLMITIVYMVAINITTNIQENNCSFTMPK